MTTNINITIPEEIKKQLEKVDNRSGLISQLLRKYFEASDEEDIEFLEMKIKKIEEENKEKIKQLQEKIFMKKQLEEEIKKEKEEDEKIKKIITEQNERYSQ